MQNFRSNSRVTAHHAGQWLVLAAACLAMSCGDGSGASVGGGSNATSTAGKGGALGGRTAGAAGHTASAGEAASGGTGRGGQGAAGVVAGTAGDDGDGGVGGVDVKPDAGGNAGASGRADQGGTGGSPDLSWVQDCERCELDPKNVEPITQDGPGCTFRNGLNLLEQCRSLPGVAEHGPKTGATRAALCTDLLSCARRTGCAADASGNVNILLCLCGPNVNADCMAIGACAAEVMAAAEADSASSLNSFPGPAVAAVQGLFEVCDINFCPVVCMACVPSDANKCEVLSYGGAGAGPAGSGSGSSAASSGAGASSSGGNVSGSGGSAAAGHGGSTAGHEADAAGTAGS